MGKIDKQATAKLNCSVI